MTSDQALVQRPQDCIVGTRDDVGMRRIADSHSTCWAIYWANGDRCSL